MDDVVFCELFYFGMGECERETLCSKDPFWYDYVGLRDCFGKD